MANQTQTEGNTIKVPDLSKFNPYIKIIESLTHETMKSVKATTEWQKAIQNLQLTSGGSIGKVQALETAFRSLGTKGDDLRTGFSNLSENIDKLAPHLENIGVKTKDVNGNFLSSDEIFINLNKKLAEMPDSFKKTAIEMEVFGKSGAALNEGINTLGTSMGETFAKTRDYGLLLTNEQSDAINSYNGTLGELKLTFEGFSTQIGANIIPVFDNFLKVMGVGQIKLGDIGKTIGLAFASMLANIGFGIITVGELIQGMVKKVWGLAEAAVGATKFLATLGNVGADEFKKGLDDVTEGNKQMSNAFGKGFDFVKNVTTTVGNNAAGGYDNPSSHKAGGKYNSQGAGGVNTSSQSKTEILSGKCCCCDSAGKGSIEKAVAEASVAANRRLGAGADRAEVSNRRPGEGIDRTTGRAAALDPWAKFLDGLWKSMQSASGKFVDDIKGGLEKTISDVFSGAKDPIQAFTDLLNSSLSDSLKGVMDFLGKSLSDALKPVIDSVSKGLGDVFKGLGMNTDMASGLLGAINMVLNPPATRTSASQTGYGNPNPPGGTAVQSVQQVRGIVAAPETPMANINVSLSEAMKPTNMLISQSNSLLASILFEIQGLKNFTTHSYPR